MNPYSAPGISLTPDEIISLWTRYYGLTLSDIHKKDRHMDIVRPCQILIYCLRTFTDLTLYQIGEIVHKDHATLIYSYRKVKDCYLNDKEIRVRLNDLLDELNDLSGKVRKDTLWVEITRDDLLKLMPELSEDEQNDPMVRLWYRYRNRNGK